MSVISELILDITNLGYSCKETTLEKRVMNDQKLNEFVTVIETIAEYEEGSDAPHDYEVLHMLEVGIFVKRNSDEEAISRAKAIKDEIFGKIRSKEYGNTDILIERLEAEFLDEQNKSGYRIELSYTDWDMKS